MAATLMDPNGDAPPVVSIVRSASHLPSRSVPEGRGGESPRFTRLLRRRRGRRAGNATAGVAADAFLDADANFLTPRVAASSDASAQSGGFRAVFDVDSERARRVGAAVAQAGPQPWPTLLQTVAQLRTAGLAAAGFRRRGGGGDGQGRDRDRNRQDHVSQQAVPSPPSARARTCPKTLAAEE